VVIDAVSRILAHITAVVRLKTKLHGKLNRDSLFYNRNLSYVLKSVSRVKFVLGQKCDALVTFGNFNEHYLQDYQIFLREKLRKMFKMKSFWIRN